MASDSNINCPTPDERSGLATSSRRKDGTPTWRPLIIISLAIHPFACTGALELAGLADAGWAQHHLSHSARASPKGRDSMGSRAPASLWDTLQPGQADLEMAWEKLAQRDAHAATPRRPSTLSEGATENGGDPLLFGLLSPSLARPNRVWSNCFSPSFSSQGAREKEKKTLDGGRANQRQRFRPLVFPRTLTT